MSRMGVQIQGLTCLGYPTNGRDPSEIHSNAYI